MRVLVTGIRGFAGRHLVEFLSSKKGVKLHGLGRTSLKNHPHPNIFKQVTFHPCDILEPKALEKVLRKVRPEGIFHLAAQSHVFTSWQNPEDTLNTNILGQLNLFEAVRRSRLRSKIHIAGSSEAYGLVLPHEIPVKETAPFRPLSPYGVSKAAQDLLAYQYGQNFKLPIVRTRAFGQAGPGQNELPMISNFAKQISLIEAGRQKPVICVGNLEAVRDFTDVRDVVRAYWLALERGEPGEAYNICSGVGHQVSQILDIYLKLCRVKVKIRKELSRMRPSDVMINVGDATKFREQTSWKPEIPFTTMLLDVLNYWRENIGQ